MPSSHHGNPCRKIASIPPRLQLQSDVNASIRTLWDFMGKGGTAGLSYQSVCQILNMNIEKISVHEKALVHHQEMASRSL